MHLFPKVFLLLTLYGLLATHASETDIDTIGSISSRSTQRSTEKKPAPKSYMAEIPNEVGNRILGYLPVKERFRLIKHQPFKSWDLNRYLSNSQMLEIVKSLQFEWLDMNKWKKVLAIKNIEPVFLNQAFVWACAQGNAELIKMLLQDRRLDPSVYGNLAMRYILQNYDRTSFYFKLPRFTLNRDDNDEDSRGGLVPVTIRSRISVDEIVEIFVKHPKFDPTLDDNDSIRWAAYQGHDKVVKLLLQDPRVDPSTKNNFAIRGAARNGHSKVVEILLKHPKVDPTSHTNFAIRWASQNGMHETVKVLLRDSRIDPTVSDNYCIRRAAFNGHAKVVEILMKDPRVDPTALNNNALVWAAFHNHVEVATMLLSGDRRVTPSTLNNPSLLWASFRGYLNMVLLLLDHPGATITDWEKSLLVASFCGHLELVKFLLQDPRVIPGQLFRNAIIMAKANGHDHVAQLLFNHSTIDPRLRSKFSAQLANRNENHMRMAKLFINEPYRIIQSLSFGENSDIFKANIKSVREPVEDFQATGKESRKRKDSPSNPQQLYEEIVGFEFVPPAVEAIASNINHNNNKNQKKTFVSSSISKHHHYSISICFVLFFAIIQLL